MLTFDVEALVSTNFKKRKLLFGRLAEIVVAETINDGIDAHDVTRRVRQRAQPIGDL